MKIEELKLSKQLHNLLLAVGIDDLRKLAGWVNSQQEEISPSDRLRSLCYAKRKEDKSNYPGLSEARFAALFDAVLLHALTNGCDRNETDAVDANALDVAKALANGNGPIQPDQASEYARASFDLLAALRDESAKRHNAVAHREAACGRSGGAEC